MKMTSGMVASSAPTGSKPSSPERWPSWNTQTSAPKVAPSDSTFMTTALTATTTEPVMRNSSTSVAAHDERGGEGRRSATDSLKSTSSAASPVTSVAKAGRSPAGGARGPAPPRRSRAFGDDLDHRCGPATAWSATDTDRAGPTAAT